jgi:uncharacterized membrane protein YjjP (DUF1212 family)
MHFRVRVIISRKHLAKIQKREFTFMKVVYNMAYLVLTSHVLFILFIRVLVFVISFIVAICSSTISGYIKDIINYYRR